MRGIALGILLIVTAYSSYAQYIARNKNPIYKTFQKDTINIRGIVLDEFNKPMDYMQVCSKNKEIVFYGLPIYVFTNRDGQFELKGALFRDTLTIDQFGDRKMNVINTGSRYIEIHLPPQKEKPLKASTIDIIAKRKTPKGIPSFEVLMNANISDYFGLPTSPAPAYFPGGYEKLVGFVQSHLIYPDQAVINNIEGEVEIGFTVERDESLSNYKVIRGIGYGCDAAVINVLKHSPRWHPAADKGRLVASQSSVIINFKLTDK
jgi:hypothetical protein